MKYKPQNLTPNLLNLVRDTYTLILKDNVITDKEMGYLKKLHWIIYNVNETNVEIIKQDLTELKGWTIKDVSR